MNLSNGRCHLFIKNRTFKKISNICFLNAL
jgi:hypothetical protein